jgi:hypothetical protein
MLLGRVNIGLLSENSRENYEAPQYTRFVKVHDIILK